MVPEVRKCSLKDVDLLKGQRSQSQSVPNEQIKTPSPQKQKEINT